MTITVHTKNRSRKFNIVSGKGTPCMELIGSRSGDAILVENMNGLGWFFIKNDKEESCTWE